MPPRIDLVRRVTRQIAELRRQEGLTQERLAELLDVPVQHISRIEAGQNITLATLERFAVALGQKASALTKRDPPPLAKREPPASGPVLLHPHAYSPPGQACPVVELEATAPEL